MYGMLDTIFHLTDEKLCCKKASNYSGCIVHPKMLVMSMIVYFQSVVDKYGAVIKMLDTGDKIKVDQAHLETVIPAIGL